MNRETLIKNIFNKRSVLCVGLDADVTKLPLSLKGDVLEFNRQIIDATIDLSVAYKINTAFYEALGSKGWDIMQKTVSYIRSLSSDVFIIADAKRADIGNTSQQYAKAFFDKLGLNVDAVTVSPYLGKDSIDPFFSYPGKWVIILALTSNSGAEDFQLIPLQNGKLLFEVVTEKAISWGNIDNTMLVVGATQIEYLAKIRKIAPHHFLLIPGIGAQGGDLQKVLEKTFHPEHANILINISRSIIFASNESSFALSARNNAMKIVQEMRKIIDI
ncbi:MAG: orotidine-5'-phosphate decarboxylase [Bacteroidales bacterium]|nr:orotidine-5'-phosphate decarboxylase [Bacteroidales bacterium]